MKGSLPTAMWLLLMQPLSLWADEEVGRAELDTLTSVLTGDSSIGFFLGLAVTVLGIWKMFVADEKGFGFILLICGVAITVFPGVFQFAQNISLTVANAITGG
jgi:hypothetical protein